MAADCLDFSGKFPRLFRLRSIQACGFSIKPSVTLLKKATNYTNFSRVKICEICVICGFFSRLIGIYKNNAGIV